MLGVAIVLVDRARPDAADVGTHPTDPTSDQRATAEVVDATVEVIRTAGLADPAGATALMSCRNVDEPPYRVAVDTTFKLPQGNAVGYLRGVADAMVRSGWSESEVTGANFGHVLTRGGITATVHRTTERTDLASLRLHGQCRVTTDHRAEASRWTDVTGQLRVPG